MQPIILYRDSSGAMDNEELIAAQKHFVCTRSRTSDLITHKSLVIGRYSVLPFYEELERDLHFRGTELINSLCQHRYLADVSAWYLDLVGITPETWFSHEEIPDNTELIVKGRTNSRKFQWKTHMFAKNKREAGEVAWRLNSDEMLASQGLCFRRFEKLKTYLIGFQDMPVTDEYRFFVAKKKVLCGAYYWANYYDDLPYKPMVSTVPKEFLEDVISRVGNKANFYTIDVAQKNDGSWIVVELNDGQMSGLSMNDPNKLYTNLYKALLV